ncbi:hypothetical protein H6G54_18250 [Anabaena cylindrica FACHB-243]|uniref:Uncharacterized protein n=1 Tax=Anabaena cylindrica (strain ATCC 27899 / PCC 7122) TaxID=272123 RepID=K9ZBB0_ANACC|nr:MULTISPECIES: hypothetical protein [Anabaena]AFZ56019.1 hypothetical protein Anacy_0417 [Anabaena cylindrica PCC 7122]MBD2419609.1 hypothetical protein [Anabaena cylindrica FACHB-243]MBY5282868.1 hypothetical protein [Anabaena sp. CCAP 1446/1C]MBY5306952.1 hypothetical protein [Anabaena sp. CCAP 1446/1C]MCM2408006.1 hypothetical protein [Anabaena sp. CCAP 1446/1C]
MSYQPNESNLLVELSAEEQQLLSGGKCYYSSPKRKAKKLCGDYEKYDQYRSDDGYDSYPDSDNKCGE